MSYIQVVGELQTPLMVDAVGVTIRFTAATTKESVKGLVAEHVTVDKGAYDFPLTYGTHTLAIKEDDTYIDVGEYTITDTTPTPISLPALIAYTAPIVPPVIVEGSPVWEALFSGLTTSSDTVVDEDREQLVGDGGSVLSLKETLDNDTLGRHQLKDTNLVGSTTVNVDQHSEAYVDDDNNKATTSTIEHNVEGVELSGVRSVRKASDGAIVVAKVDTMNTPSTSYQENNTTDDSSRSTTTTEVVGDTTRTTTVTLDELGNVTDSTAIEGSDSAVSNSSSISVVDGTVVAKTSSSEVVGNGAHEHVASTYTDSEGNVHSDAIDTFTVGDKAASVTYTNDGSGTELAVEVDAFSVGSTLEVDDATNTVTINGSLKLLDDAYKGDTGDTVTEVYEYSVTGADDTWHTAFATGDIYRRTNVSTNGVVDSLNWTDGVKLAAVDGADGDTIFFVYQYSEDGANDWHTTLGDDDVYRRDATSTNGLLSAWSAAGKIAGVDGVDGYLLVIEYQYSADGVTVWHSNFTTGDHYRRERLLKYASDTTLPVTEDDSPVETGAWSSVGKIVPVYGVDYTDGAMGANGTAGLHGSGSYIITNVAEASVGLTDKDADLLSVASRVAQAGDILTYTDTAKTFSSQFLRGTSTWASFTLAVDGDAIINGTLAAEKLIAATITGDKISAVTTITAGSDATTAGMNGNDTEYSESGITNDAAGYRFWAGAEAPANAPYSITKEGALYATDAYIQGEINATSGTYSGDLNVKSAESGSRIEIVGDCIKVYDGATLKVKIGNLA